MSRSDLVSSLRDVSPTILPSLLMCDFGNLASEIETLEEAGVAALHLDVMDGVYVPNFTYGMTIVAAIRKLTELPLDVHLMIEEPSKYIEEFVALGAEVVTIHIEAERHLHRTIQRIKALGIKAGVALNPHTSVDLLDDILEDIDLVCLMSVNPGYGGQKFIYQTIPKVKKLRAKCIERNLNVHIEIDGGVGAQNAEALLQAGADRFHPQVVNRHSPTPYNPPFSNRR